LTLELLDFKIKPQLEQLKNGIYPNRNRAKDNAKRILYLTQYQWVSVLYLAVAIYCWQYKYFRHIYNNYLIFRQVYYHAREGLNLYAFYPKEYYDQNHYGPVFSMFISPFAILPEGLGFLLWQIVNAMAFLIAIHMLPFTNRIKTLILLFCVIEFANTSHYMQSNAIIAAFIILSFVLVKRGKDEWATACIVLGTFIKLYPVIGFVFFLFSKNKLKFILSTMIWMIIFFICPMVISSPSYVIQSYHDWFTQLAVKNSMNVTLGGTIDWCVMGVARRLSGDPTISNMPFLAVGMTIFAIPLLRFKQFASLKFRLQVLTSALIVTVIFSTGAEHPTFIIATAGAVIYIMMQNKPFTPFNITLLILLLVITGLGPSDAFPRFMRDWIEYYAVKAWPCIIIWIKIAYELIFKNFIVEESTSARESYNTLIVNGQTN